MFFSVLNILEFIRDCSPVMQCCHFSVILVFNIAITARGLASHKTQVLPTIFSLNVLYQVGKMAVVILKFVFVFVTFLFCFLLHFSVSVVSFYSSYRWCVFPRFSL